MTLLLVKKINQKQSFSFQYWYLLRAFFTCFCVIVTGSLLQIKGFVYASHRGFLEHWNSQKSVSNIWPQFSCRLDEGILKLWKKLNFHDGFLTYLQNSTANSAHLAANFCPALVCPQKATVRIQFSPYFWNPLIK